MCGRYGLKLNIEEVVNGVSALSVAVTLDDAALEAWQAPADIAPTDAAPVVVGDGPGVQAQLTLGRWGITRPADVPGRRPELVINARCETLHQRPLFRPGLRALLPASGWYEWPQTTAPAKKGTRRAPMWLHRPVDEAGTNVETLLWVAALAFRDPADVAAPPRFVIVTRPPEAEIACVHDRMPALVPAELACDWMQQRLFPADLQGIPHPRLRFTESAPRPSGSTTAEVTAMQFNLFGPPRT